MNDSDVRIAIDAMGGDLAPDEVVAGACGAAKTLGFQLMLVGDERLRQALGRNGRDYVRKNYRWDVVVGKYERLFAKIRNAR